MSRSRYMPKDMLLSFLYRYRVHNILSPGS